MLLARRNNHNNIPIFRSIMCVEVTTATLQYLQCKMLLVSSRCRHSGSQPIRSLDLRSRGINGPIRRRWVIVFENNGVVLRGEKRAGKKALME